MRQPVTWSFTTATTLPTPSCPCSLWPNWRNAEQRGEHRPELGGAGHGVPVLGQRAGHRRPFYKTPSDPSTSHTGTLWTANGTQLATGTFTNETGVAGKR